MTHIVTLKKAIDTDTDTSYRVLYLKDVRVFVGSHVQGDLYATGRTVTLPWNNILGIVEAKN